uniref:Uncharacterized protein n=1 Tax=Sphaerodactylus townsendi TaxID=933632 RepID=A0ACB8EEP2_9SAUR
MQSSSLGHILAGLDSVIFLGEPPLERCRCPCHCKCYHMRALPSAGSVGEGGGRIRKGDVSESGGWVEGLPLLFFPLSPCTEQRAESSSAGICCPCCADSVRAKGLRGPALADLMGLPVLQRVEKRL